MTNNLLVHINRKKDIYRDWKSTRYNNEYENIKINFKSCDKLVTEQIKNPSSILILLLYAHRNNMKQMKTITDETLNDGKRNQFHSKFTIDNKSVTYDKKIPDKLNIFFANIGAKLSSGNDRHNDDQC